MAPTRVLLLGASGKVARLMIPPMLRRFSASPPRLTPSAPGGKRHAFNTDLDGCAAERGWKVFGVVRNPDYAPELKALGSGVEVLVESLEDVKGASDAKRVIDSTKPDYIVWSAG